MGKNPSGKWFFPLSKTGFENKCYFTLLYKQLKSAFSLVKFNLRKWCSNSPELLQQIPKDECELKALVADVATLGVRWSSRDDDFSYNISVPLETTPTTKRELSSEIAKLYDPLGWLSPLILSAKNILKQLWKEGGDWDDKVDSKFIRPWMKIKNELALLNDFKIPRWINYGAGDKIELHGFCDASEVGYAAAIYFKNVTRKTVRLLIAKSRVAPIKKSNNDENVTIPRLELCGALLLAELMEMVVNAMELQFEKVVYWTDAKIVLGWINGNPDRYKKFIQSRKNNAADCASRGLSPFELIQQHSWWFGPKFLLDDDFSLPTNRPFITDLEQQIKQVSVATANVIDLEDALTYDELIKSVAMKIRKQKVGEKMILNCLWRRCSAPADQLYARFRQKHSNPN